MPKHNAGEVYGEMTLIALAPNGKWICRCSCGVEKEVWVDKLARGDTVSCGHVRVARTKERNTKHGHTKRGASRPSSYQVWHGIRQRCENPNSPAYPKYGGRGIVVDPSWHAFAQFYSDMGDRPEGLTLERRNNDGPYSKDNCYWATRKAQARNTRRTRRLTYNGETLCLLDWAARLGISRDTLYKYLGEFGEDEAALEHLHKKFRRSHVDPAD